MLRSYRREGLEFHPVFGGAGGRRVTSDFSEFGQRLSGGGRSASIRIVDVVVASRGVKSDASRARRRQSWATAIRALAFVGAAADVARLSGERIVTLRCS